MERCAHVKSVIFFILFFIFFRKRKETPDFELNRILFALDCPCHHGATITQQSASFPLSKFYKIFKFSNLKLKMCRHKFRNCQR